MGLVPLPGSQRRPLAPWGEVSRSLHRPKRSPRVTGGYRALEMELLLSVAIHGQRPPPWTAQVCSPGPSDFFGFSVRASEGLPGSQPGAAGEARPAMLSASRWSSGRCLSITPRGLRRRWDVIVTFGSQWVPLLGSTLSFRLPAGSACSWGHPRVFFLSLPGTCSEPFPPTQAPEAWQVCWLAARTPSLRPLGPQRPTSPMGR